ncbi:MAG: isochorismatase family cysteine hydrolase [Pseudomonadota bacterium]|nr:isochorismatase family cysteine hydrolase [Pseudomonadota bacterium]
MTLDIRNANPAHTALLVMDHQRLLVEGYMPDPDRHLKAVAAVVAKSRAGGLSVIYVRKAFRPGYPEVHDANIVFSAVRAGGRLLESDEMTEIPAAIAPTQDDIVVRGCRISAFEGTELALILRARKIDTLVMFGIATSGVVLSTVRQGADMDYRMFVVRDLCGDNDAAVHDFLMDRILPRQAAVISSSELLDAV